MRRFLRFVRVFLRKSTYAFLHVCRLQCVEGRPAFVVHLILGALGQCTNDCIAIHPSNHGLASNASSRPLQLPLPLLHPRLFSIPYHFYLLLLLPQHLKEEVPSAKIGHQINQGICPEVGDDLEDVPL